LAQTAHAVPYVNPAHLQRRHDLQGKDQFAPYISAIQSQSIHLSHDYIMETLIRLTLTVDFDGGGRIMRYDRSLP
jgi:hypothetical protein